MVYDSNAERVIVSGGYQIFGPPLGEVWAFDGVNWTQVGASATFPGSRAHGLVFDAARDRLVGIGGIGERIFNPFAEQWEVTADALAAAKEVRVGAPLGFQVSGTPGSLFLMLLAEARSPGVPFGVNRQGFTRVIPLAGDRLFMISLGFGLAGILDQQGKGSVSLSVPLDVSLAGFGFFAAGVLADPAFRLSATEEERVLLTR
jgi:hypothetical protein